MLFLLILTIVNFSFAKQDYINARFKPLRYFGGQSHIKAIHNTEFQLQELQKRLNEFHETFYVNTNTSSNVISSTNFKRPDIYLRLNNSIEIELKNLNKAIDLLFENSLLGLQNLEMYNLPSISLLPDFEQKLYEQLKQEAFLSSQEHLGLIKHLTYTFISVNTEVEEVISKNTKSKKDAINHQILSEVRQKKFEKLLFDINYLKQVITHVKASAADIFYSTKMIEDNYKKSLAEKFYFFKPDQLDEIIYDRVERHIKVMYEQVKKDVSMPDFASNRFVIKRYKNKLLNIITDLEVILTVSHEVVSQNDYEANRKLKEDLQNTLYKLEKEQSIHAIIGFLSRHNGAQSQSSRPTACSKLF